MEHKNTLDPLEICVTYYSFNSKYSFGFNNIIIFAFYLIVCSDYNTSTVVVVH